MSTQVDYNNRYYRVHAISVDAYGVDPLKDKMISAIAKIQNFKLHVIGQDEEQAPDLISYVEYGTEDYWWHIMAYNGLFRYRDFTAGLSIKIPSLSEIVQVTTDNVSIRNQTVTRVITI